MRNHYLILIFYGTMLIICENRPDFIDIINGTIFICVTKWGLPVKDLHFIFIYL